MTPKIIKTDKGYGININGEVLEGYKTEAEAKQNVKTINKIIFLTKKQAKEEQSGELQSVRRQLAEAKNWMSNTDKKELSSQLKGSGATRFTPNNNMAIGTLRSHYDKLLFNVRMDKNHIGNILPYRKKVLQHRITAEVTLLGSKGEIGIINIFAILVEHQNQIFNFWNGREIDPSSWGVLVHAFASHMTSTSQTKGAISISAPRQKDKVNDIRVTFTYG